MFCLYYIYHRGYLAVAPSECQAVDTCTCEQNDCLIHQIKYTQEHNDSFIPARLAAMKNRSK